jgi:hypothetical protein
MGASFARRGLVFVLVALFLWPVPATSHKVRKISIRSICHYEENYYVWAPGEPWKVFGRVKPSHDGAKVVLDRTKRGTSWRRWKSTRTDGRRYVFRGTAPHKGQSWYVNLRVRLVKHDGHDGTVSGSIYVDENRHTRC